MAIDLKKNHILSILPDKPGVYQFIDASGRTIYVGKAKNLKKRVYSYFTPNQSGKTTVMLNKAVDLKHIVVDTESDALLLENNLIKRYQPRYNILLKDDKSYPRICIKNEHFPRVFITRNIIRDGSHYFGPYTSAQMVRNLISLIKQVFTLRTCNYNLTQENINAGKFKPCLEYYIGNCKAPCVALETESEYSEKIDQIRNILNGKVMAVTESLKAKMSEAARELQFETAQSYKEKLDILDNFRTRSAVVSNNIRNVDVFGFTQDNEISYVNYLKVVDGAVIQGFTLDLRSRVDEERESVLASGITELRQKYSSDSPEIIVPFMPDILLNNTKYLIPKSGDKLKLLELAERNAVYYKLEQKKKLLEHKPEERTGRNLEKVRNDLHMPSLPTHIECFDNSNIMGKNPVSACVVFRNGKPSKKDYRHFNIKSVSGPNDFASMEEVILRRYRRILDDGESLPQLVIIDGGKGQLSSAMKSISGLGLQEKITVIGIAKKLEEIYFPGDSVPIYLDKNSYTLKLIQQLRDEAHRFGINFHRNKRSTEMIRSELDQIKGIGPRTKEALLKKFKSIGEIKNAGTEELEKLIGKSKTSILRKSL
jgi:excinuclease ABC subunit C